MGLAPNINRTNRFTLRTCTKCGQSFGPESFAPTKSLFYPDGVIPVCNGCVENILKQNNYDWAVVDKLCQYADIPFVPREWEKLREMESNDVFYRYASIFLSSEYENLGWGDYYKAFVDLKKNNQLEDELPAISEERMRQLKRDWGENYDDEALEYLENMLRGLVATQNVNGSLQIDQARKICKMSYEIDRRIAEGTEFDKLLSSYDKLVKTAEFTPKNAKNINDFDTFGEAARWLEKAGWRNKFYDGVSRDIVDESMKNFQAFNQRLYTNESGMGDEITRRIDALKTAAALEQESNYYGTKKSYDLDEFEQQGYDQLIKGDIDSDFKADPDEDGDGDE